MQAESDLLARLKAAAAYHTGTDFPERLRYVEWQVSEQRRALQEAIDEIVRLRERIKEIKAHATADTVA